jgi:TatD DNase family protein
VLQAGFYLGVGGIATFKKSEALREIIRHVPIEFLLLETDSPYLAPQARRGRRNEPAYAALIAESLARVLGIDAAELARVTSENAARLFGPSGQLIR